jgi:hypothetical protein
MYIVYLDKIKKVTMLCMSLRPNTPSGEYSPDNVG